MRTIKKLGICALMIFSFTACYPLMYHGDGGHGRYYYNNHNYNSRQEYRQARRQGGSVEVRVNAGGGDNQRENR